MPFDAAKEAEKIEQLAKERLDTSDATKGQEIASKLSAELMNLDRSQLRAVLTELKSKYNNSSWDTLPVPQEITDERGVVVGIGFRASHLDFSSGPGRFDTLFSGVEPKSAYEPKSDRMNITNVQWDRYSGKITSQDISAKDGSVKGHEEYDSDTGKIKSRDLTYSDGRKEHWTFDPKTEKPQVIDTLLPDAKERTEFDANGRPKLFESRDAKDGHLAFRQEHTYDTAAGIEYIDMTYSDGSRARQQLDLNTGKLKSVDTTGTDGSKKHVEYDQETGKPK